MKIPSNGLKQHIWSVFFGPLSIFECIQDLIFALYHLKKFLTLKRFGSTVVCVSLVSRSDEDLSSQYSLLMSFQSVI